eukprot:CAMPEP_0118706900 /NCGR_PEP_ID=MMETSP0800-20121206/20862_1 /TAXON_ID=210618 ORGANISM="Striatella unipunctata, Strain CCMP2910" /NCGR_SAMPLE_ID=MMETSP0800 /ASSEMBLY_ACC=CAM_ASM_000638 /LENGTH=382 /DNA_ID=CAMNT_0006609581 /DNA_START=53 /DNA_END=1201 /DNA_ORIENTATION=-
MITGSNTASDSPIRSSDKGRPYPLRRSSSGVARSTVGGQFSRQLKELRKKIDLTQPHYVRCLKPNDDLVPDRFDRAIVASQLRCGGILEAIRVSRAGFTQHYPHEEFYRRYKSINRKKQTNSRKSGGFSYASNQSPGFPGSSSYRNMNGRRVAGERTNNDRQLTSKEKCEQLLKGIWRKIEESQQTHTSEGSSANGPPERSRSFNRNGVSQHVTPMTPRQWKSASSRTKNTSESNGHGAPGNSEMSRRNIQMGNTKVFLRQKVFELIERLRGEELSVVATLINSVIRMYLARIAYLPVRDAYREEILARQRAFHDKSDVLPRSEFESPSERTKTSRRFESDVRATLHNRGVTGGTWRKTPTKKFKWVLVEGRWVRNEKLEQL